MFFQLLTSVTLQNYIISKQGTETIFFPSIIPDEAFLPNQ